MLKIQGKEVNEHGKTGLYFRGRTKKVQEGR